MKLRSLFVVPALAGLLLTACHAQTVGQYELRKRTSTGFTAYGITLANDQVIGLTDGIPAAITLGAGTGTVTSVALTLPSIFSVAGSPVTTSGTLAASLATQTANTLFAGPTTGSAAAPSFRALVAADIPNLSAVYEPLIGTATLALSKLATDPLARANHTGTQLLATISDAGTLAALSAVASAQITDGTIVNADISASAAIDVSKISGLGAAAVLATSTGVGTGADSGKALVFGAPGNIRASQFVAWAGSTQKVEITMEGIYYYDVGGGGRYLNILPAATPPTSNAIIRWPGNVSGDVVTTGDTETVTNTMLAGSIANAKLANSAITIGGAATSLGGTVTATTILDSLGSTQGQILYRNATAWVPLAPGTNGQILTSGGAGANPSWTTATGTGTVTSVALSGSDGIEIDSGSPITTTGTIALGINAATLKTFLALDAVENTALSTWAGTSNITTLGTIATGVWSGTALVGTKVDAATTTTRGTVELATDGETNASVAVQGNDTRLVNAGKVEIGVAASDETSDNTASTTVPKLTFRMPHAMTLTGVRCSLTKAATGATFIVDIHESGTTLMTTNKLSVDASETTSTTAATAATLTDTALADDAVVEIFIDQVGTTTDNTGEGVKVWLIGTR